MSCGQMLVKMLNIQLDYGVAKEIRQGEKTS